MKLAHRNAIITGGTQGLGRAIVEAFVREGASVLLCARNEQAAADFAEALRSRAVLPDQRILAQGCDVSDSGEVETLFGVADTAFDGPLHILVNNAGVQGPIGPTDTIRLEEWQRCLEINLFGTLLPCREAMKRFKAGGTGGKIVNLSGGGATSPMPNITAYAASKAAVVRLTESLALELRPHGVTVNALAPGAMNTQMLEEMLAAGPEKIGADVYARCQRQAKEGGVPPELAAECCVFLASPESDGITGKLISAKWDPWKRLPEYRSELEGDIYALRRITPEDRGKSWPLD